MVDLEKQDGEHADKAEREGGDGEASSGALVVTTLAARGLSFGRGLGLFKAAFADIVAPREPLLVLEGVVELLTDVADVSSRLEVENTLDEVQRRRLDPEFG